MGKIKNHFQIGVVKGKPWDGGMEESKDIKDRAPHFSIPGIVHLTDSNNKSDTLEDSVGSLI